MDEFPPFWSLALNTAAKRDPLVNMRINFVCLAINLWRSSAHPISTLHGKGQQKSCRCNGPFCLEHREFWNTTSVVAMLHFGFQPKVARTWKRRPMRGPREWATQPSWDATTPQQLTFSRAKGTNGWVRLETAQKVFFLFCDFQNNYMCRGLNFTEFHVLAFTWK